MKLKQLFLTFFLMAVLSGYSQMLDLSQYMDQSKLVLSQVLYNQDESVYGYLYIYYLDNTDKYNSRYEYIVIDKNLNLVVRNSFSQEITDRLTYLKIYNCRKLENKIIISIGYIVMPQFLGDNTEKYLFTAYRMINLADNSISSMYFYDGEKISDVGTVDTDLQKKYRSISYYYEIYPIDNREFKGFVVEQISKFGYYDADIKKIKIYDINLKELWNTEVTGTYAKNTGSKIDKIFWPDETILMTINNYKGSKETSRNLCGVNMVTGKKMFEYTIDNNNSKYYYLYNSIKKYGDTIYISGIYNPNDGNRLNDESSLGWFRIAIDTNGKEIMKKHIPWTTAGKFLTIKDNGKVEGGYRLKYKAFFQFRNGTSAFLAEKYKGQVLASTISRQDLSTSTDMMLVTFNDKFEVTGAIKIDKATNLADQSDYLFSQYINDNSGVVFFFKDDKQDKADKKYYWYLGINKLADGKYSYDEFKLGSYRTDYFMVPGIAKEGYILLREYNEKEKYNQIRLEKLNL